MWKKSLTFINESLYLKPTAWEKDILFTSNIVYNSKVNLLPEPKAGNGVVDKSKHLSMKNNIAVTNDPGFVDAKNGNFQLKADAEILKQLPNFKNIEFNKIGLNKW